MGADGMTPELANLDLGTSLSISSINGTPLVNSSAGRLHLAPCHLRLMLNGLYQYAMRKLII